MTASTLSKRPITFLLVLLVLLAVLIGVSSAENATQDQTRIAPDWLEPMGLNLATLTGLIPESDLHDAVLVWIPGSGTVKYDSGVVSGDNIAVTVNYNITNKREVWCLGESPQLDHTGTVQPPATMRVYSNGTDVTSRIQSTFEYVQAGQIQPDAGANTPISRYPKVNGTVQFSNGSIVVPANRGCKFMLDAALPNVTAVFTMPRQDKISITKVYHHVNTNVHSYIGVGAAGNLAGLQSQMGSTYPFRHDPIVNWFDLTAAQKAAINSSDYVFIKSPTSSHDMYGGTGDSHGTYRFAFNTSSYEWTSTDHVSAALLPRLGHWRDADTQGNQQFLDYFQAVYPHGANIYENFDSIKSAELFLPPGMSYQPCMTAGNCSSAVLQQVYNHTYRAEAIFYRVERIQGGDLEQVPLLAVGKGYAGRAATATADDTASETQLPRENLANEVYIPIIFTAPAPPPPDNPAACPGSCGWFDEYGQMLDFVPPSSWTFP